MITGIGTDIVEVTRFEAWVQEPLKLSTLFTAQEIADCVTPNTDKHHIAERLAARFAAKEAFYKALSATLVTLNIFPQQLFTLIFTAPQIAVSMSNLGTPTLIINWKSFYEKIGTTLPPLTAHLSLSHEKTHALAFVVISRQNEQE